MIDGKIVSKFHPVFVWHHVGFFLWLKVLVCPTSKERLGVRTHAVPGFNSRTVGRLRVGVFPLYSPQVDPHLVRQLYTFTDIFQMNKIVAVYKPRRATTPRRTTATVTICSSTNFFPNKMSRFSGSCHKFVEKITKLAKLLSSMCQRGTIFFPHSFFECVVVCRAFWRYPETVWHVSRHYYSGRMDWPSWLDSHIVKMFCFHSTR